MCSDFVGFIHIPHFKLLRRNLFTRHWSIIVFIKQILYVTEF